MASTILNAQRGNDMVWLADASRGAKGLTCCVCEGRLKVCDGQGQYVKGKARRNAPKGKYFAHVGGGGCYGEGVVHHELKVLLAKVIKQRLQLPAGFMGMPYVCPSPEYAPNCIFKVAPGMDASAREFPQLEPGHHHFDLLKNLHEVKVERWLGGRATRADIVGLDREGSPLWVIEVKRTSISDRAIEHAKAHGYPLFVIEVTHLPMADGTAEAPVLLTGSFPFYLVLENAQRGFLPRAVETYNTECYRQAFGMGPIDHQWSKEYAYLHRGPGVCDNHGCPDCEKVLLHECGGHDAMGCPDKRYMFQHRISTIQMYTDPVHMAHSHVSQSAQA